MDLKRYLHALKKRADHYLFLIKNLSKEKFLCPVCGYRGPFEDICPPTGLRKHARCWKCRALERHRIQYVVVSDLLSRIDTSSLKMLHFAPELFLKKYFSERFGKYETADLSMADVDYKVDLQELPFEDQSYDFVFASHVLEHIPNDTKAVSEIRRILRPNGIAILPVPLVAEETIEYPEPNAYESYHVRAPGLDYYDRYSPFFPRIDLFDSDSFPKIYQLYVYEDRSRWPTKEFPLRLPKEGEKHIDIVPVCYV